tara:strand:- start:39 stop:224 length:186 start_codon:yes stop_codon:yes gene_type:complete
VVVQEELVDLDLLQQFQVVLAEVVMVVDRQLLLCLHYMQQLTLVVVVELQHKVLVVMLVQV